MGSKVAEKAESGIHSNRMGGRIHASGEKSDGQDTAASRPMDRAGGAGELEEASTEKGHADGELSSAPARARAIGKGEGGVDQWRQSLW